MKKFYFDMDGTMANFYKDVDCLEKMYEVGFFQNLEKLPLAEVVNSFAKQYPEQVFVLSACINDVCEQEKKAWCLQYLPNVSIDKQIYTRVGENKAERVGVTSNDYLIDDYSVNLIQWMEMNGKSIKAYNTINCKGVSGADYYEVINVLDKEECVEVLWELMEG